MAGIRQRRQRGYPSAFPHEFTAVIVLYDHGPYFTGVSTASRRGIGRQPPDGVYALKRFKPPAFLTNRLSH
jgi:hypothetical protein